MPVLNGHTRASTQAGYDPHTVGWGTGWLASLLHRLAGAFSWRDGGVNQPRPAVGRDVTVLIARRAERVSNRKRKSADRFIAVHKTLARGRA